MDKIIFGGLITGVLLVILIGPFYFFSSFSSFIEPNPVQSGEIEIRLNIKKRVSYADIMDEAKGNGEQALDANVRLKYDEADNACTAVDASAPQRDGIERKTYYGLARSNCRLLCDKAPNCHGFEFYQSSGSEEEANCVQWFVRVAPGKAETKLQDRPSKCYIKKVPAANSGGQATPGGSTKTPQGGTTPAETPSSSPSGKQPASSDEQNRNDPSAGAPSTPSSASSKSQMDQGPEAEQA